MSQALSAIGGTPPYTWTALDPLPAGLSLSSAGVLSGSPATATVGTYYTIQVQDSASNTATLELWITVLGVAAPVPPVVEVLQRELAIVSELEVLIQNPAVLAALEIVSELEVTIQSPDALPLLEIVSELEVTISDAAPTGDPNYSNVSLLLHGDSGFTDNSPAPKTVSAVGNAQISTAQAVFGGGSILLDGTGDRLSVPNSADFDFGDGDFTIELFVRFNAFKTNNALITNQNLNNQVSGFSFYLQRGTLLFDYRNSINAGAQSLAAFVPASVDGGELITDTWYYLALSRSGSNLSFYVNGELAGSPAFVANGIAASSQSLLIGASATTASRDLNAYLDEIRITKGMGRAISGIPSEPFPDS